MGTTYCCMNFLFLLSTSDWVQLFGVIVNATLAYWIVRTIQNKLTNRRVLKDYFINEIKEIRNEYKTWMSNLYSNTTQSKRVIPWFKLMNIKVDDLMTCINAKYNIDKKLLSPYQNELRELVTENEDFIKQFESSKPIEFSEVSRSSFIKFQQEHNQVFNHVIIMINDSK
jgi:hypothetical protein